MAYDAKYNPLNLNYLSKDWSGNVTANDLAIQNQPWSLGQHQGATPEQLAQQEREQWFRDRGLDPNKYYGEQIEAQAPQPGFNPAGGKVNQGKPLKQQTIGSDGRTAAEFDAQQKANKVFEKQNERTIDRKALLANPHTAIPLLPNKNAPIVPAAPSVPGMPVGAPISAPIANSPIAAPIQSSASLLPNYMNPMQMGQPNAQPTLPQQQQQQQSFATPRPVGLPAMPSQQRPQSFGNAAKLLQLPSYLRRGMGGIRTY